MIASMSLIKVTKCSSFQAIGSKWTATLKYLMGAIKLGLRIVDIGIGANATLGWYLLLHWY